MDFPFDRCFRLWAPICLGVLASCTDQPRPGALLERSDSAGVEIIQVLTSPPDTLGWERTVRIGSDGAEADADLTFGLISDLVVVDGGILVVDYLSARVSLFDLTGTRVADIGRRGIGPGEHVGPFQVRTRDDTLFIWDANERRLSRYLQQTFQGSVDLPSWSGASNFAVLDGGYLRQAESGQLIDPAPAQGVLVRTSREGAVIDTVVGPFPVPEYGWTIDASGIGTMINPPALAISPPWATDGDRLWWLDPLASRIEITDLASSELLRVVRLPHRVEATRQEDQERFFEGLQLEWGVPDEAMPRLRASTIFAATRPKVAGILLDDRGRVWIADHDPRHRGRDYVASAWDVYDFAVGRAYRAVFPDDFHLRAVHDGLAFGVTTLDTGAGVVDILRLK